MKILIILATAFLAVTALSIDEEWDQYKITHKKRYESPEEERLRFKIYQDNLEKINQHNRKYEAGLVTYFMEANKFADLTTSEFRNLIRSSQSESFPDFELEEHVPDETIPVPETIDWRVKDKAVLGVEDQEYLHSVSWAFSVAGAIEGQNAIKNKIRMRLSKQELVDCTSCNPGCTNGTIAHAMEYILKNGLSSDYDYPYQGINQTCIDKLNPVIKVKKFVKVGKTEADLQQAVGSVGPISARVNDGPLQLYGGGIIGDLYEPCDVNQLNLDVLVIGYASEDLSMVGLRQYWIVKNSLGAGWGEGGYFKLLKGIDKCGIALSCTYPVL